VTRRAFTLPELILATSLTVLVVGATAGLLRASAAGRERAARRARLRHEAQLATGAIARALVNADRAHRDGPSLVGVDDWLDDRPADRLAVWTVGRGPVRHGQPESDVREVEFRLARPSADAPTVLLRRTDPTRNPRPDAGGVVEPIAEGVYMLDLTYHDGAGWREDWPARRASLPRAVRVRVAVADPDAPDRRFVAERIVHWPRLFASSGADANAPTEATR
jgi:type II secretory pathway pseudopilin PulG